MFYYNQYVRAQSLDEAYELYQKKPNFVLGGMLWLKMKNKTLGTAIDGNAALTDNSENNAKIDKFAEYVAEHIRFGSNIRAGAEYREIICRVLTRRAVTQSLDICDEIKHKH
jgi:CO/xanthine dehydrogenase FAD-binding subunit